MFFRTIFNPPVQESSTTIQFLQILGICGNCPMTENLHTKKSEEILANDAVEAAFSIIYLRLLFSSGLNFSIKYILYTPLKFCCHRKLQKTP